MLGIMILIGWHVFCIGIAIALWSQLNRKEE